MGYSFSYADRYKNHCMRCFCINLALFDYLCEYNLEKKISQVLSLCDIFADRR